MELNETVADTKQKLQGAMCLVWTTRLHFALFDASLRHTKKSMNTCLNSI